MLESAWGWLIATYLFLAGAGAGAFLCAVAGPVLAPDWSRTLSRAGSLVSGPLVLIGTLCLVLDLEAGLWEPWRQIYLVSNPSSMIMWGVVVLSGFIPVALLYAAAVNDIPILGPIASRFKRVLEIAGSVLAVATAGYTGVLIAVINGVPFWNTPLMPVLFLLSAVSAGLALSLLTATLIESNSIKSLTNFSLAHVVFLLGEAVVLGLFVFMSVTRSEEAAASAASLLSGPLSPFFWGLVVVLGIVVPLFVSFREYRSHGSIPKFVALGSDALVLVGGMSLRAVIIFSGQPPQIL